MDQFLKQTIKECGQIAKKYFAEGVQHKTKRHIADLVTVADVAVSDFFISQVQERYPDHGIHSEEREEEINPESTHMWYIDPIDGTRNFANAIPVWCVQIALYVQDELILAAVYDPLSDELFFAGKGKGATMNGLPIKVSSTSEVNHSYGSCVRGYATDTSEQIIKANHYLVSETKCWLHNFGTMLLAQYVASGGADFYAGNAGFDHDYVAPALICREAGALVTDFEGNEWKRGRRDIIIANPELHKKLLPLFQ